MNPPVPQVPDDAALASVVDGLTEILAHGKRLCLADVKLRHPEFSAELEELWPVLVLADEAAATLDGVALHFPDDGPEILQSFEDFEIQEALGRGGMGVVYRARQKSLDRIVALKVLRAGEFATEADVARFRAEAQSAARLSHPNIVPVYAVGENRGQPWFAMRLIEGATLAERLRSGPMTARGAASLLMPIAKAIAYAHRQGILHRDIKPSNILVDALGIPSIADFGLAHRLHAHETLTRTGAILGTPSYMAPEQAAGERGQLSLTTDTWGLGAVLYHMVTGRPPFLEASAIDTVMQVLHEDPPLPRLLNPRVDRELEMIILKALQKPQDLRYPDAEVFAADLSAFLEGNPTTAASGRFRHVLARAFSETHHASVLENWGLLWMAHAVMLFVFCLVSNVFLWWKWTSPLPYLLLWGVGFGAWAATFWRLRRRGGPVTFVERQLAHVWAGCAVGGVAVYPVEVVLGLPLLFLAPVLGILAGTLWIAKAGILSGRFYLLALLNYANAVLMARFPDIAMILFGAANFVSFAVPGLAYQLQGRRRALRR